MQRALLASVGDLEALGAFYVQAALEQLSYPVIVKPAYEGSSKGILSSSVVHDEAELRRQVGLICGRYVGGALVETFLPGREFTVGILGGRVLAPMEIVFQPQAGAHPVYSFAHKIDTEQGGTFEVPAKIPPALDESLRIMALQAFHALGCRDVARVDLRLDGEGRPHFIECNPLPGLSPGWSDLCVIAEAEGMSYTELIAAILAPALTRLEATTVGLTGRAEELS